MGMVVAHSFNPRTWETEAEVCFAFKASQGYILRQNKTQKCARCIHACNFGTKEAEAG